MFYPPKLAGKVSQIPDTVSIHDFMLNEEHGRRRIAESLDPYTCGLTGKTFTAQQQKDRVAVLARAISRQLGWKVNEGSEYDKVAGIFAFNTVHSIDIMTVSWAIHRLNGIPSPTNAGYNADEVGRQLLDSRSTALFTVLPLLPTAIDAAQRAGIPSSRIFLCEMSGDAVYPKEFLTVAQLIEQGESLPELEPIEWTQGQGTRQTAFLCYSSGTSGLPKGVMISHRNVIANVLQLQVMDQPTRDRIQWGYRDVALGFLPQSHIYGLVVICHLSTFRGDRVIVLPKYDLRHCLASVERYSISTLYLVPPVIVSMVKDKALCDKHDLRSVRQIITGAAPLGQETASALAEQYPSWSVRQGYGMTETCTAASMSHPDDLWLGSGGCLLAGYEAKLMSPEGREITSYDQPGELLLKSPTIVLGYLNNDAATHETFIDTPQGRFIRTGDEVQIRLSPNGHEHIWVVDRLKELIKVKGHQISPAELEACLLDHPAVAECAVISVPEDGAGEVPKAFVVRSLAAGSGSDEAVSREIQAHVEKEKARFKWLRGGIEFTDNIPKSASGKILRRMLRDRERDARRRTNSKL